MIRTSVLLMANSSAGAIFAVIALVFVAILIIIANIEKYKRKLAGKRKNSCAIFL